MPPTRPLTAPSASPAAPTAGPTLLVTRPEREAQAWLQALAARGIRALALPLISIGPAPDPAALACSRQGVAGDAAVMFVSANAVRGFFAGAATGEDAGKEAALPWPAGTRAWATGPGTAAALREAGVPDSRIDRPPEAEGRFDSEALWDRVKGLPLAGRRVLIVRGADAGGEVAGRAWLAQQLEAAGAQVAEVAAYRRGLPAWGAEARALLAEARAADAKACWLFSSSEAVANLARLEPGADWSGARALCTHARIAQAARAAGFGRVDLVAPGPEAVAAFLQSQP